MKKTNYFVSTPSDVVFKPELLEEAFRKSLSKVIPVGVEVFESQATIDLSGEKAKDARALFV